MEEVTKIELGKTYKCETCGKEDVANDAGWGIFSFTVRNGKVKCLKCDMDEFYKEQYGTAND